MKIRAALAALAVAAVAMPTLAADPGADTLYLRASEGACADKLHTLEAEAGEGETTCNTRVGVPLYEVDQQAGLGLFTDPYVYTASKDVVGFTLDATANLAGTLTFRHGSTPSDQGLPPQPIPAGGGMYEIDVEVKINGDVVVSEVLTAQTGSMDFVAIPFEFDLDDALNGIVVEKLSISIGSGGVTPNSGWVRLDGHSFINVPRA